MEPTDELTVVHLQLRWAPMFRVPSTVLRFGRIFESWEDAIVLGGHEED